MSLTGSTLLWLLVVVCVGYFTWTVIAWPRSGGPGVWAVLRRIGYQLGLITLVMLTLGVAMNDQYDWYANWADLGSAFSSSPPRATEVSSGAAATAAAAAASAAGPSHQVARGASNRALGLVTNPGPDGQYRSYQVDGKASHYSGHILVWFPTAYTDATQPRRRFPVLEAFHGIPGGPGQFSASRSFHLGETISQLASARQLAPAIVVMPNFTPRQVDTECVNGGAGQLKMETWITRDVTEWVDQHLRTQSGRGSWATLGFSAGAYCASMVALLHPSLFSAAISLGGYYQPSFEKPYVPFTPDSSAGHHYDLVKLASTAPPPVALWVQTSKADHLSYQPTEQLLRSARPPLSVTADVLENAGHRLGVWVGLTPQALRWLGSALPGFRPAQPLSPTRCPTLAGGGTAGPPCRG